MTNQKKAAQAGEQGGQDKAKCTNANDCTSSNPAGLVTTQPIEATQPLKPTECRTKKARVLNHLTHYGSLNRFEAQHLGDTALNSTISTLSNMHDIVFDRRQEVVLNRFGGKTRVKRYKVADVSIEKAVALLGFWRVRP